MCNDSSKCTIYARPIAINKRSPNALWQTPSWLNYSSVCVCVCYAKSAALHFKNALSYRTNKRKSVEIS